MNHLVFLSLLVAAGCTQTSANVEPRRPQQAGQPLDSVAVANRMASIQAAALTRNQDEVREQVEGFTDDYRRSIKPADPARAVDREAARTAARSVPGVRSIVWVDRENLLAIVASNEQRSQSTIDAICLQLEPLGDTLGVVVNLQSGAARTGDELEILSRNCQLAPGDRAMFQANRKIDVIAPEVRLQHKANQATPTARRDDEALRQLEASTPEM